MLSMIGKFGISAAFAIIYVFSAELFPTMVRNSGMGSSSVCARVGGIASPYIADLVSDLIVKGETEASLATWSDIQTLGCGVAPYSGWNVCVCVCVSVCACQCVGVWGCLRARACVFHYVFFVV